MNLNRRFFALMAQALHAQASCDSLEEIRARLFALADAERGMPLTTDCPGLEDARFAVYAWVDEKMLNATRPDASAWMSLSLQCRYFSTTEAGQGFYDRLNALLDALGIRKCESEDADASCDLAWRLEEAQSLSCDLPGRAVLSVFALCLLYGFRGRFFEQEDLLLRVRRACLPLVQRPKAALQEKKGGRKKDRRAVLNSLESIGYIVVPILVCILFWLFCAVMLARIPLPGEAISAEPITFFREDLARWQNNVFPEQGLSLDVSLAVFFLSP